MPQASSAADPGSGTAASTTVTVVQPVLLRANRSVTLRQTGLTLPTEPSNVTLGLTNEESLKMPSLFRSHAYEMESPGSMSKLPDPSSVMLVPDLTV
jgi:hypothetical protein